MRQSIRAEAERRGVSYRTVQRERASGSPEVPGSLPGSSELANRIRYYRRVLRLNPSAVAAQLGITEAEVLAVSDAPTEPAPPARPSVPWGSGCITQPSIVGPMSSADLSGGTVAVDPPLAIVMPGESVRLSAD